VTGLDPATPYAVQVDGAEASPLLPAGVTTLERPAGRRVATFATANDVHFGETHCGMIGIPDEPGPVFTAESGAPPYPEVMNHGAIDEMIDLAPDAVLVKGDLTDRGTEEEYAAFCTAYGRLGSRMHHVRGNHDAMISATMAPRGPLTVELDGVLYCHASPRRDDEMLTRLSTRERFAAALADVALPLVVAGHTHQQDDRTVGRLRFINAGSVGLPYDGDGDARWLWVEDGVPSLHRTPYDHVGAGTRILAAGWPDEQSTRAALVEPMEPILITKIFEERTR